jgi:hypothetical protein
VENGANESEKTEQEVMGGWVDVVVFKSKR